MEKKTMKKKIIFDDGLYKDMTIEETAELLNVKLLVVLKHFIDIKVKELEEKKKQCQELYDFIETLYSQEKYYKDRE
jgi:hypothetical protein